MSAVTVKSVAARGRRGVPDAAVALDHVVCGVQAAPIVLAALAAMGCRVRPEVAVMGRERPGAPLAPGSGLSNAAAHAARRAGFHLPRAGTGRCDAIHFERFAAPARTALFAGGAIPPAAALGATCLRAGAIETAVALADGVVRPRLGRTVEVRLEGGLARWVGGWDVGLSLAMPVGLMETDAVVFGGPGFATLSVADRMALARVAEQWGAPVVHMPSDDATRVALAARGRDHDWKRFEPEGVVGAKSLALDLDRVEPMLCDPSRSGHASPVRHLLGMDARWIVVGSLATYAELARVARVLRGRRIAEGVRMAWVPGSLQALETATATGVELALRDAGVEILRDSTARRGQIERGGGIGLACGVAPEDPGARAAWGTGPECCAAAALHGRVVDPRTTEVDFVRDEEPTTYVTDPRWLQGPISDESGAWFGEVQALPVGAALDGPLRGTVLADVGDAVSADEILPEGPRVAAGGGDTRVLAGWLLAGRERAFAARAKEHGGGVMVAGLALGAGPRAEVAALALSACGVRAVMARTYAPDFARALVRAGILPLRWRSASERAALARGEEVEIPGLPESLAAGKPLVVRNLTRGLQITLPHDLDDEDVELLRVGGAVAARAERAA